LSPAPSSGGEGEVLRIAGYAALFDVADGVRDTIRRGAFARTLARRGAPLPLLWQHRAGARIGTVERVNEDRRGLRVIARIDRPRSRAAALLRAGAVDGLSFGFLARGFRRTPAGWEHEEIAQLVRRLATHSHLPTSRAALGVLAWYP